MDTKRALPILSLVLSMMCGGAVAAASAQTDMPNASSGTVLDAQYKPEVTARVARISFISGDAQVRRSDGSDWETATLNLPLVEGDELTTSPGTRVEIQFDKNTFARLAENAYIKLTTLKDEGIVVSLPSGTMLVTVDKFDKDRSFFEIDAPTTTVALQRSGMYRVDAGQQGDDRISVSVFDKGEARIYSDSGGFTLKDGRMAMVYIAGPNAGEWATGNASKNADDLDTWASSRDDANSRQLKAAYYNRYYDDHIYGADDLDAYGQWIDTAQYGYVWQPYSSSLSTYANWTPYRYGTWRWLPPYGWTWVNDEPWGWATYHYGRWFYWNGSWNWSPYGSYRYSRSWWSPALVVFTTYAGNYCWYPLPYNYAYYNFNYYYFNTYHSGGHHGTQPTPAATPDPFGTKGPRQPPIAQVPPIAVITVPPDKFGAKQNSAATANNTIAQAVLKRMPRASESAPVLPDVTRDRAVLNRSVRVKNPPLAVKADEIRTGATSRTPGASLDEQLRTTRMMGGRAPAATGGTLPSATTRNTGAVVREPVRTTPIRQPQMTQREPVRTTPTYTPPSNTQREPVRTKTPYIPPPNTQREPVRTTPTYTPPRNTQREPVRQAPTYSPPAQREPVRQAPIRAAPKEESRPAPLNSERTRKKGD